MMVAGPVSATDVEAAGAAWTAYTTAVDVEVAKAVGSVAVNLAVKL